MKAKRLVQKGKHLKRNRTIHTTVRFRRPKTLSLPRQPRYQRKSVPHRNRFVFFFIWLINTFFVVDPSRNKKKSKGLLINDDN